MPYALKQKPVFEDPILAVSFKDRNDVRMLSTVHSTQMFDRNTRASANEQHMGIGEDDGVIRRRIPVMTQAYNRYMQGVDGLDQLASYNPYPHRSHKWYIKLFDYILEITLINARILLEKHKRTKISGTAFRQALINQLLARHLERIDVVPGPAAAPQRAGDAPEPQPEPQHWFTPITIAKHAPFAIRALEHIISAIPAQVSHLCALIHASDYIIRWVRIPSTSVQIDRQNSVVQHHQQTLAWPSLEKNKKKIKIKQIKKKNKKKKTLFTKTTTIISPESNPDFMYRHQLFRLRVLPSHQAPAHSARWPQGISFVHAAYANKC